MEGAGEVGEALIDDGDFEPRDEGDGDVGELLTDGDLDPPEPLSELGETEPREEGDGEVGELFTEEGDFDPLEEPFSDLGETDFREEFVADRDVWEDFIGELFLVNVEELAPKVCVLEGDV